MVSNIGIGQFSNNSFESLLSTNAATNSTFVSNDYDFVSQTFRNSSESLELYYFYRVSPKLFWFSQIDKCIVASIVQLHVCIFNTRYAKLVSF